jgi:hypothetical protein
MGKIVDKVKKKVTGAKDKVKDVGEGAKETMTGSTDETYTTKERASSSSRGTGTYEEGAPGTDTGRKDDPLTSYRDKEPMTPAKIKEHEPTAVKREMTEKITEPGQQRASSSSEKAKEIARKSGMAKGTAGAAETGDEYEQGAAGANK